MRRIAMLGVVFGLVGAEPAGAVDFGGLPYFNMTTARSYVATDGSWDGARVVPYLGSSGTELSSVGFPGVTRSFVWGTSCGRAQERRVFTKKFLAPGVPVSGTFDLSYVPSRDRPYLGATIAVNGVTVGRLGKTAGLGIRGAPNATGPLSAAALAAFRYGENTVTITATKAKLKRGQRCEAANGARTVGVMGDLQLEFASDLSVSAPTLPEIVRNVVNGQSYAVTGTATVNNVGPSAALNGTLRMVFAGDGRAAIGVLSTPAAPFTTCTPAADTEVVCSFAEMQAGTSAGVPISAAFRVNTVGFRNGAGELSLTLFVDSGLGTRSINNGNESQRKTIVFCTAGATDPRCR